MGQVRLKYKEKIKCVSIRYLDCSEKCGFSPIPFFGKIEYHLNELSGRLCMYLLTVKDGVITRHVGPYSSPQQASDDLERILSSCSERARWQIHALESPKRSSFSERLHAREKVFTAAAS